MSAEEIVLFESSDNQVSLPVEIGNDTVWLTQAQMSELFSTTKQNVSLHINNCFKEGELSHLAVVKESLTTASDGKSYKVKYYNLDVVISVGYRVKSQRGVEFRQWATQVLRKHIIEGHTENERRLAQLGQVAQVMKRLEGDLDATQILDVVGSFTKALDLLDDYDHQTLPRPTGTRDVYQLSYEECRAFIDGMKFGSESDLFGNEKDESFKGSLGAVYQSFDDVDMYPSVEEKAANLLYFIVKNHSFSDGNKRIGAAMFLYFLNKNGALFHGSRKRIPDSTLAALTIMIAESRPEEKEAMISLVLNFFD
ncbi:MAG: virulence RhuM family protein [Eggerthellaceae bacterium]|nr:virulence RhuM family protein [Eggerthellaceae bacterium]